MTEKPRRHRWSDKVEFPLAHKSERECLNGCGIVKVTRHESEAGRDQHWIEFWRGLDKISVGKTPACEPAAPEQGERSETVANGANERLPA